MNARKARKIRKQLGMTKENLRQAEYGALKTVKKVVYFRDGFGQLLPSKEVVRQVVVNKSKYFYRKVKKQFKKGF